MSYLIRKVTFITTLLFVFSISTIFAVYAADPFETERLIKRAGPPPKPTEENKLYLGSYFEISDIVQGAEDGHWSEWVNTAGFSHKNIQVYSSISDYSRFHEHDYTANLGSYITFPNSYVHAEAGFGWDLNYIYRFQTIAEYAHRLYKDLYWQAGYNYRNYDPNDTHVFYPGLIYYFGDSYISANYGAVYIQSRAWSSYGTIKGDFAITKFLHWWSGVAFGDRLYDIYGDNAYEESGYILFTGATLKIYKDIYARIGVSYSQEEPKFIKRSLDFGLSVRF